MPRLYQYLWAIVKAYKKVYRLSLAMCKPHVLMWNNSSLVILQHTFLTHACLKFSYHHPKFQKLLTLLVSDIPTELNKNLLAPCMPCADIQHKSTVYLFIQTSWWIFQLMFIYIHNKLSTISMPHSMSLVHLVVFNSQLYTGQTQPNHFRFTNSDWLLERLSFHSETRKYVLFRLAYEYKAQLIYL